MHCTCGKFMKLLWRIVFPDRVEERWHCKCGWIVERWGRVNDGRRIGS